MTELTLVKLRRIPGHYCICILIVCICYSIGIPLYSLPTGTPCPVYIILVIICLNFISTEHLIISCIFISPSGLAYRSIWFKNSCILGTELHRPVTYLIFPCLLTPFWSFGHCNLTLRCFSINFGSYRSSSCLFSATFVSYFRKYCIYVSLTW